MKKNCNNSQEKIVANNRLSNIDFIKTIMMVAVVFYHALLFFGGSWFTVTTPVYENGVLYIIAKWMNTFHIQVFAMASGFLFYYLKIEKNKYKDPKNDIKKRAKRLLIPYFFACAIWAIPIDCLFLLKSSAGDLFHRYALMADPSQMWFLVMLFLVFMFFEFFSDRIKVSFKNLLIILVLSTVLSRLAYYFHIDYFQLPKVFQYILYFYFGGFIYYNKNKISAKQAFIMALSAVALYICSMFAASSYMKPFHYMSIAINPIVSILEAGSIYYFCTALIKSGKIKAKSKIYKLLEDNSFGIYLFHQQIVYFTIVWLNGLVHPVAQALLSFVIALSVSLLMSWLLKKWRVTRFMFGL